VKIFFLVRIFLTPGDLYKSPETAQAGSGALELARKHGIKTTILQLKFNAKFDHRELYGVNCSRGPDA